MSSSSSQRKLFLLSSSFWVFGRKLSINKDFPPVSSSWYYRDPSPFSSKKHIHHGLWQQRIHHESDERGDEKSRHRLSLPRFLRAPFDSVERVPTEIVFPPVEVQRRTTRVREVSVRRVRYVMMLSLLSLWSIEFCEQSSVSLSLSDRSEMIFSSHVSSPITIDSLQVHETRAKDEGATRRRIECRLAYYTYYYY